MESVVHSVTNSFNTGFLEGGFISVSPSVILLVLLSISLSYFGSAYYKVSRSQVLLYTLYIVFVLPVPGVLKFNGAYISAAALLWSAFYMIKFITQEKYSPSDLFISVLGLSLTALFTPETLPVVPVCLLFVFYNRNIFLLRSLVISIGALLVPWIWFISILVIFDLADPTLVYGYYIDRLALHGIVTGGMGFFFATGLLVFLVRPFMVFFRRYSESNRVQRVACALTTILTLLSIVMMFLYSSESMAPLHVVLMLFPSMSLYLYLSGTSKKETGTVLVILLLSIICFRIFC